MSAGSRRGLYRPADRAGVIWTRRKIADTSASSRFRACPHPLLDAHDVGLRDHPRAERVAKIVEVQGTQAGASQRPLVSLEQRGRIEIGATGTAKDQPIVVAGIRLASPSRARASATGSETLAPVRRSPGSVPARARQDFIQPGFGVHFV